METAHRSAANGSPMAALPAKVHHVFLPRRVPGCDDAEAGNGLQRGMFVDDVLAVATKMQVAELTPLVETLQIWTELQGERGSAGLLGKRLKEVDSGGVVPFLAFEQNALLLFERRGDDTFFVHACEVLPANAQAFEAQSVEWPVPQVTFNIPRGRLLEVKVVEKLVELANAPFPDCAATTFKRGVENEEIREPPFPRRLFEWLLPSVCVEVADVSAYGEQPLVKKLRHHVSYKNAKCPWTRSMEWSAVKAVCHWVSSATKGGRALYKCLMLRYMTELLEQGHQHALVDNDLEHNMKAKLAHRAKKLEKETGGTGLVHDVLRGCLDCAERVKRDHDGVWASLSGDDEKPHLGRKQLQIVDETSHDVEAVSMFCDREHLGSDATGWEPPVELKPKTLAQFLDGLHCAADARSFCRALGDIENWIFSANSSASGLSVDDMLRLLKTYHKKAAITPGTNRTRIATPPI